MTPAAIANGVIQMSLVLAAALLAARLLRRRSAALRHAIVAAGVVCACATPLIRSLVPEWDIKPVSGVILFETSQPAPVAGRRASIPLPESGVWRPADVVIAVWASGALVSLLVLVTGLFRLRQLRAGATRLSPSQWRNRVDAETAAIGARRHVTVLETSHPAFAATWVCFAEGCGSSRRADRPSDRLAWSSP